MSRTILHVDLNSFYASVELIHRPELRDKPVAVCGDAEARHGIVLAKSEMAKKAGVKTGDVIWEARLKCPGLVTISADFSKYLRFSRQAREIYADYTDQIENYGIDESWLDVTGSLKLFGSDVAFYSAEVYKIPMVRMCISTDEVPNVRGPRLIEMLVHT